MNLLLRINRLRGKTVVMVTHSAELECYADRTLFVRDGRIVAQHINLQQTPLELSAYLSYLDLAARGEVPGVAEGGGSAEGGR